MGGYCWVRTLPSSWVPYLGRWDSEARDVWGVYRKVTSRPVTGLSKGGRNMDSVCGIEKVRCSMWCPMRHNAWSLDGLVKALAVKVKRVLVKRIGVVSLQHSDDVRRRVHNASSSSLHRIRARILSFPQMPRNVGIELSITCACRCRTEARRLPN
jgi:hypothetical protein